MVESMTGYGRAEYVDENYFILVEVKSLNSRYADISINLPNRVRNMEIDIQQLTKDFLKRGNIYINVDVKEKKTTMLPKINKDLLMKSLDILYEIQKVSGILDDIRIDHILYFKDIINYEEERGDSNALGKLIIEQVVKSLDELKKMRQKEGEKIKVSLEESLKNLNSIIIYIKEIKDEVLKKWFEKLNTRIKKFSLEVPEERLVQEAAVYADRGDITEEVERVGSHISQFLDVMSNEYPNGRKLDFLCQEFVREFHTMGAKIEDIHISEKVLLAKSEVEKIREQVQNIV